MHKACDDGGRRITIAEHVYPEISPAILYYNISNMLELEL